MELDSPGAQRLPTESEIQSEDSSESASKVEGEIKAQISQAPRGPGSSAVQGDGGWPG